MTGLIGPCRRGVTRLRLPERGVGGEGKDGVPGDGRTLIAGERAVNLGGLVGQRQLHAFEALAAAELDGRVRDVAPVNRYGIQRPAAQLSPGPDEMRTGLNSRDRELAVLVDTSLRLAANCVIGRRRGDAHVG